MVTGATGAADADKLAVGSAMAELCRARLASSVGSSCAGLCCSGSLTEAASSWRKSSVEAETPREVNMPGCSTLWCADGGCLTGCVTGPTNEVASGMPAKLQSC